MNAGFNFDVHLLVKISSPAWVLRFYHSNMAEEADNYLQMCLNSALYGICGKQKHTNDVYQEVKLFV